MDGEGTVNTLLVETLHLGPVMTNCYIYSADGAAAVVIDAAADARVIVEHLDALELRPVGIISTHGHLDHIGANAALKIMLGVPLYAGAGDAAFFGPDADAVHRQDALTIGPEAVALFQQYYTPSPAADVLLNDGDAVSGAGLRVLATPGHTAGGVTLVADAVAFTGDALFAGSIGRTDLCGGDERLLLASIKNKILTLPPQTRLFPGHGPPTSVREEREHNPYLG